MLYAVCFVALAVFGFGGFQFSGIDSVAAIVGGKFGIELSTLQRYMFIVVPVIAVVAVLVLSKKHELFMGAMTYMIGTAVAGYFVFFTIFVLKTANYIPTYFQGIIQGMINPVNGFAGITLGFVLGMQKIIQTAETGLGALAMAAQESDSEPREAAMISLIPTVVTVVVSIVVTSYIASYGLNNGIIQYLADAVTRLTQYFATAQDVTGIFGLVVLCTFTVLSALTTILGSYYYMTKLFKQNSAIAMAAQESDSEPREAAMISLIPTVVTVVVSIVVTSYIASYGLNNGIIQYPADAVTRLTQYFATAQDVTGMFGLVVLCTFTVLSALTTILGSYYYMTKLFKQNSVNKNIAIYLMLIITAGTLAVFGANVVFEAVDLLLFVLSGINVTALLIFSFKKWEEYKYKNKDIMRAKKIS